MNVVKASDKPFIVKLPLWSCRLQGGNLANFIFVDEIVVEGGTSLLRNVQLKIVAHMESLSTSVTLHNNFNYNDVVCSRRK